MTDLIWIGNGLYPRWVVFAVIATALIVAEIERLDRLHRLPGHDETMANLDALTIRSSPLTSNNSGGE